ncbi:PEGA domain-containing protein [Anoxybacter fermentans]|nr:PEGA domain-containing protein [Anoxybacter fermentans]
MDRTNSHLAVFIFIIIIVGSFAYALYAYNNAKGEIMITSPLENIVVYMDGQMMGKTPIKITSIPLGFRAFRFEKEGFESEELLIDFKPNSKFRREVYLSDLTLATSNIHTSSNRYVIPAQMQGEMVYSVDLEGRVDAIQLDRVKVWSYLLNELVLRPVIQTQEFLIVGTFQGSVYAFNRYSGKILWQRKLGIDVTPLVIKDKNLWLLANRSTIYRYTLEGELLKKEEFEEEILAESFVFLDNSPAFFTVDGTFWHQRGDQWYSLKLSINGGAKQGIITDDFLYLLSSRGVFYAFSHTGKEIYSIRNGFQKPINILLKDYLYISSGKKIYILEPESGSILNSKEVSERIVLLDYCRNKLWVGGEQGFLYLFDETGKFITARDMGSLVVGVTSIPGSSSMIITTENSLVYLERIND